MSPLRSRLNCCLTAIVILALLFQPFNVLAASDPARAPRPAPSRARSSYLTRICSIPINQCGL